MYKTIISLLLLITCFSSCIKDDTSDCPDPARITVEIKDKNYDNIGEVEKEIPVPEDLPMLSYIDGMSVWWRLLGSAESHSAIVALSRLEMQHILDTDPMAAGTNEILVIGNELIPAETYNTASMRRELHPGNSEYADIYMGSADMQVPVTVDETIPMYRTKGKLLLEIENLPATVSRIVVNASGVYETVGKGLSYEGTTDVSKSFPVSSENNYDMLLAPSLADEGTALTVELYDDNNNKVVLSGMNITMTRNEITLARLEYQSNEWSFSLFLNGDWAYIDHLTIQ